MPFERLLQKAISQRHNSTTQFFYAKIDDHGIRWGNKGQILARWRRPVASRVALDLPYWRLYPTHCATPTISDTERTIIQATDTLTALGGTVPTSTSESIARSHAIQ